MLLTVLPVSAAFAEEIEPLTPEKTQTEDPWATIEPTPIEETNEAKPEFIITQNGDETIYIPVAPDPNASIAIPDGAPEGVDWDLVTERMFRAMYYGERVDMLDLAIEYNDAVRNYIYRNNYYNPRFLRMGVNSSSKTIDGVSYLSAVYVSEATSAVFRNQYDACVDALESLMRGVKDNTELSDVDKCLILHDRLCTWCEYDYVNYLADSIPEDSYSAYGALGLRLAVCNGIALAYGWMLDLIGIENYYTSSYQINHGWNMVYIDGEPYYVDVTWDDPVWNKYGRARHQNFMQSFATFSQGHQQATDFSDAPVSTIYEDYFCTAKNVQTEICLIDGDMYYLDQSNYNAKLIRRTPAGEETELLSVPYYTVDSGYIVYPYMLNIGHTLLYTQAHDIHAYDVRTGTDTVVFAPDESYFPDEQGNEYGIMGFRLKDGLLEAYIYNKTSFDGTGLTQAEFDELKESHRLTFTFCEHENEFVLEQLKGPSCLEYGEARTFCPDCGKLEYVPGEGLLGDHSYTDETVKPEAHAAVATCVMPAQYYYSCEYCGLVERDDAHTFGNGDPLPHAYASTGRAATPTCPGHIRYLCPDCGAVAYDGFTFYEGNSASGVIEDAFAWQIVDGVLSICGAGALPDFTSDALPPWHDCANTITSLVVNDDITAIGNYNFYELSKMTQMTLPEETVSIGNYAFAYDSALTAFVMPRDLLHIGAYAFTNANRLASITNNEKITSIDTYAFTYINDLQNVVIPGTVVEIGRIAFGYLYNVRSIVIEEGTISTLPTFFWFGYSGVSRLAEIRIPSNIRYIDSNTISNSLSHTHAITVAEDNPYFTSVDGVLYSKDMTSLIKYPGAREGVYYHVPDTVTSVSQYAFMYIYRLKYLDLRDTGIVTLDSNLLYKCTMQMNINLPARLSRMNVGTFDTYNMQKLYVPASVITISEAFSMNNAAENVVYYTNSDTARIKEVCDAKGYTCVELENHTHDFSELAYSEEGTCVVAGIALKLCECGEFNVEVTGAHDYTAQTVKAEALKAAATCRSAAVYYYSCAYCGAVEGNADHTFTSGAPAAHDYTAQTVKSEALKTGATCENAAVYYYSCSVCGNVEMNNAHTFVSGAPLAHNWEWKTDTAATCNAEGVKHEECSKCHATRNLNTPIPKNDDHRWNSGSVTSPASCTEEGIRTYTCTICGNTRTERIPKTAHVDTDGDGCCDSCGASIETPQQSNCVCGQYHTGPLAGLSKFFHSIIYFFKNLFK